MNSRWTSLNPPPPPPPSGPRAEKSSSLEEEKKFLNLLKTLERETKGGNDDDDGNLELIQTTKAEILDSLSAMENLYLRRGLMEYDTERAHEIQTKMNDPNISSQSNGGGGSNSKKRKRRGGGGGSAGGIASVLGIDSGNTKNSVGKEAYVLSNVCRVLIPTKSSSDSEAVYPSVIITAACNVLIAICTHCKNHLPSSTAAVEHSLIVSICSPLLSGISKSIHLLLASIDNNYKGQGCPQNHKALAACCKCASVLIALVGTRLSRNVKVMENIQNAADIILWQDTTHSGNCDEKSLAVTKESAASLLATIPLAGSSNGISPSKLWSNKLHSICMELLATLMTFCPYLKRNGGRKRHIEKDSKFNKLSWIEAVKNEVSSQAERIKILSTRIGGYISIIESFLKMDKYDTMNSGITCELPIQSLLIISEQMLSFSHLSENKFLGTKPRLRDVSVEGGLLSPKAAMTISNIVKYQGHVLVQIICSVLSNSTLVYGKRMIDMTLLSLQSSSSNALRMAVDPVSVADKNNARKWLHSSVSLRTMTVQSFASVIQRLGSNSILSVQEGVAKGLVYIVGFVLEQIADERADFERDVENEHWGTEFERAKLV